MPPAGTVACPYCNAFVPVPTSSGAGRRLSCPRCGETFAYLPREGEPTPRAEAFTATPPVGITTEPAPPATDSFKAKAQFLFRALLVMGGVLVFVAAAYINSLVSNGLPFDIRTFSEVAAPLAILWGAVGGTGFLWLWFFRVRRSNGATLLFIVGNMLALALLTLGGALATNGYRRHLDAGLPGRPRRSPVIEETVPPGPVTVAPGNLAAIRYLPSKIDLLAGVHVAELLDNVADRKLVEEPLKFGNQDVKLSDLAGRFGLQAGDIDHFVVGVRSDELLSVIIVVRSRQGYDREKVKHALKAKGVPGPPGGRTLYKVSFPSENLSSFLWCADDHTFLISLAQELIETAKIPTDSSPDPLVPEVRAVLNERIRPVGQLWIAGYSPDWTKTVAGGILLGRMPEALQKQFAAVRTIGVWTVSQEKTLELNTAMRCDNEKSAERIEKWFASRKSDKYQPALVRDGNWLSLQVRTDIDSFRSLLAQ